MSNKLSFRLSLYFKYVDDILLALENRWKYLNDILDVSNSLQELLQFAKNNNQLSF